MHDSLLTGISELKSEGFVTEFRYENDRLIDRSHQLQYKSEDCILVKFKRYEGMSDPADSSILLAIRCNDGNKGYISSAYGIYADNELLQFMTTLQKK